MNLSYKYALLLGIAMATINFAHAGPNDCVKTPSFWNTVSGLYALCTFKAEVYWNKISGHEPFFEKIEKARASHTEQTKKLVNDARQNVMSTLHTDLYNAHASVFYSNAQFFKQWNKDLYNKAYDIAQKNTQPSFFSGWFNKPKNIDEADRQKREQAEKFDQEYALQKRTVFRPILDMFNQHHILDKAIDQEYSACGKDFNGVLRSDPECMQAHKTTSDILAMFESGYMSQAKDPRVEGLYDLRKAGYDPKKL